MAQDYLSDYFLKANERTRQHVEPLPLTAAEVTELTALARSSGRKRGCAV